MAQYKIVNKRPELGDLIQCKTDNEYMGVLTKLSYPKTAYAMQKGIRFPYLDNDPYPCGISIDNWQVVKIICPKCNSDKWIKDGEFCECTECMTLFK